MLEGERDKGRVSNADSYTAQRRKSTAIKVIKSLLHPILKKMKVYELTDK